jgi:putative acetyltransferase
MKTTMPQGDEPAMPAVTRIDIRTETPADIAGIRLVEAEAFPTHAEGDLVDRLREDGSAVLSLIAVLDRQIIGHAMFSRMQEPRGSLGLGPVAVLSAHRRRGVAAGLIREGLSRAKADGWAAVFVLGDPAYYGRFGFSPALAAGFGSPYAGPHLMGLELQADSLKVRTGSLRYPQAFADLE